jgi:hypothetical protein
VLLAPSPKVHDQDVAEPVDVSVKVTSCPAVGDEGAKVKLAAGAATTTVTVVVAVFVPLGPVAVNVYVVVTTGVSESEPLAGCVPETPVIDTDVAFVVVQLRVVACPEAMVDGLALNEAIVGGATGVVLMMT